MKKVESEPEEPVIEEITYTVTFDVNGGSSVETQTVEEGKTATEPTTAPTREGYDFLGWYGDEEFTAEFDFTKPITENTTVYAKWIKVTGITSLPTTAGKYYLTQDITISSTWTVPSGETVLDLNGYGIKATNSGYSVITVGSEANLTLKDSTSNRTDTGTNRPNGVTGGYITGGNISNASGSGVRIDSGSFTMHGGTIIGNTVATNGGGGGVLVKNGSFTMYGGAITQNTVLDKGGGVWLHSGSFTMHGGSIKGNTAGTGKNLFIEDESTATIGDTSKTGGTDDEIELQF